MSVVCITGANRGIGLELVRQYAADGWRVIAACRDPSAAPELRAAAEQGQVHMAALDVTSADLVARFVRDLAGEPIDVLINNAGVFGPKPEAEGDRGQSFGHVRYAAFEEVLRINALGPLRLTEAVIDQVAASELKRVVTISSGLGSIADTNGGYLAYRASKAAVNMIMASLASELAPRGVSFLLLCPGWVRTRMGGEGAPLTPADSVRGLRARIAAMSGAGSAAFKLFDGTLLRW